MTHQIVVSRRDGILTAPDGTKHRVARGKTLADADHPAVLANPGDWVPMVVTLTLGDRTLASPGVPQDSPAAAEIDHLNEQVTELEETLASRDAEMTRLAEGLAARDFELPAEDEREPGWLVDFALEAIDTALEGVPLGVPGTELPPVTERVVVSTPAPAPIAPPKPRKRTSPPLMTRTGDDG